MWMPEESAQPSVARSGYREITGIVERMPQQQSLPPGGFFSGRPDPVTVFRIQTDTGQSINCRFEGVMNGILDKGDRVQIRGSMMRGVFHVVRIADMQGSVLAQSSCFVATVVFGDPGAPEVEFLRWFRDHRLRRSPSGRAFIRLYGRAGPILARRLRSMPRTCRAVRWFFLRPLCAMLGARLS